MAFKRSAVRSRLSPPQLLFKFEAWGYSSAGRAPALQAGGQRFDPAYLHHMVRFPCYCMGTIFYFQQYA